MSIHASSRRRCTICRISVSTSNWTKHVRGSAHVAKVAGKAAPPPSPPSEHPTCRHPDRDVPKLMCGYPLPCPWHTVTIDADAGTVTIPITSDALKSPARERVGAVARAVTKTKRK